MNCPATSGGLRGFTLVNNPSYDPNFYGYNIFNFKYECATGDSDFTDKTASAISGTSSTKTNVDVCKTDGTGGHINIPVGNTCSCPDGYIIKNLQFFASATLSNYVSVNCICAKVKDTVTLKCENKQTLRMSLDNMNGYRGNTLYDFVKIIPVI